MAKKQEAFKPNPKLLTEIQKKAKSDAKLFGDKLAGIGKTNLTIRTIIQAAGETYGQHKEQATAYLEAFTQAVKARVIKPLADKEGKPLEDKEGKPKLVGDIEPNTAENYIAALRRALKAYEKGTFVKEGKTLDVVPYLAEQPSWVAFRAACAEILGKSRGKKAKSDEDKAKEAQDAAVDAIAKMGWNDVAGMIRSILTQAQVKATKKATRAELVALDKVVGQAFARVVDIEADPKAAPVTAKTASQAEDALFNQHKKALAA